jgi:hypothetical protein
MALAPLDLLAAIIPAPTAHAGGLDRWALDAACAGLRITAEAATERFTHRRVQTLPGPLPPPAAQVRIHRLPCRPFLGQKAPGSAGAELGEDRSEDGAQGVDAWATDGRPMGDSGGKSGSSSSSPI